MDHIFIYSGEESTVTYLSLRLITLAQDLANIGLFSNDPLCADKFLNHI